MSLSDLVLSIADNKQMLGLRYAEWATRAPSLEADIAAAAMGLDDLGHSRVLYGCLEPLGADPRGAERESDPASLRALPYFDQPWSEWAQFVAANAILDTAFTAMGCPASEFILEDVRERLLRETGVREVRVNVVWDPPWTVARMTEAGRDALESWGLAV